MDMGKKKISGRHTKAEFWKCALQVNPSNYIRFRGQEPSLTEEEYNQKLLNACLESDIKVIGMADHNSVDGVDAIRAVFHEEGITVFPGFEIESSEKVHFVCLFDENTTSQKLERILGFLEINDPESRSVPSSLSAAQIIDKINEHGGFIYAAHCTNDKGLLKQRMNHIWKDPKLVAVQIPNTIESLKGIEDDFYRQVLCNNLPEYRREKPMAVINAADVSIPEDIKDEKASCLIKMTSPCFSSFKQAFLDPESRVRLNQDRPENWSSAIQRIRFIDGYLDGLDINLSEHLNTVIGGRGTGKSTLLECVRFALDIKPYGKAAQVQHTEIIKANLGSERGMVELILCSASMNGRTFKVSRRYGDRPVVSDEDGKISPYHPKELLPRLEFYGQNEIYEMTRESQSRYRLIERFLESDHVEHEAIISKIMVGLRKNRESLIKALRQHMEVSEEIEQLPKLRDQAKQFTAVGLEEKLKIVPKLEKEKQLAEQLRQELGQLSEVLATLDDSMPNPVFLSERAIENLPHAEILREQRTVLEGLSSRLKKLRDQFQNTVVQASKNLRPLFQQLEQAIKDKEKSLEQAFRNIPSSRGKTGRQLGTEYQELLKKIERIKSKESTVQTWQVQVNELRAQRKKLLAELSEARASRSSEMKRALRRLNRNLEGKVKLNLKTESNRKPLLDFLEQCNLEGVGPKRLSSLAEADFSPANLAETIRHGEHEIEQTGWNLSAVVSSALCRLPEARLLEMEEIALPDMIDIQLNIAHGSDTAKFRELRQLSAGQQCTAILHLLLLDNQDPLILDQPEDNLDNAFIAERIVTELRIAKISRQFFFATHNANIPVFGDAEWIGVLSVFDGKGVIPDDQQGAIDQPVVQSLAANLLEGGRNAFNQRREKYGFE